MIVATVLLGPGAEKTVSDAIQSAARHVDGFLLIESGGGEAALEAARSAVLAAESTPFESRYAWEGNYGKARQFALEQARLAGARYAVTLDPDERLVLAETFRAKLAAYPTIDVWILPDRDTKYSKERVLRCSADIRWHGIVCENIEGSAVRGKIDGCFWELPKDESQNRARYERGVAAMDKLLAEGEDRFKWRRHRGSCLAGLGRLDEALDEYRRALAVAEQPEDRGWCRYLICEQLVLRERFDEAKDLAALGLAEHAGFLPEFGWILGYLDYLIGDDQNASRWAQLALHCPADSTRTSLRGMNAIAGSKSILENLHGQAPAGCSRLHHVNVPIGPRVTDAVKTFIDCGAYEADEYRALKRLLRKSDRVLELGTGLGVLATYCAKRLEDDERVLTVEADPEMAPVIAATFEANGVAPKLLIAAVSGDGRPRMLHRADDFWSTGTSIVPDDVAGSPLVPVVDGVALGNLLHTHAPTICIIDIEGGEVTLVDTLLPDCVRAVLIEVHTEEAENAVARWLGEQFFVRNDVARRVRLYERSTPEAFPEGKLWLQKNPNTI